MEGKGREGRKEKGTLPTVTTQADPACPAPRAGVVRVTSRDPGKRVVNSKDCYSVRKFYLFLSCLPSPRLSKKRKVLCSEAQSGGSRQGVLAEQRNAKGGDRGNWLPGLMRTCSVCAQVAGQVKDRDVAGCSRSQGALGCGFESELGRRFSGTAFLECPPHLSMTMASVPVVSP